MLKWTLAAIAAVVAVFLVVGGMFEQGLAQMKSVVETKR